MKAEYYLKRIQELEKESNAKTFVFPSHEDLREVVKIANVLRFAGYKVKICYKESWFKEIEVTRK